MELIFLTIGFAFIALASKKIGQWFSKYGLPYITGYLLAGAVAGPFILGFLPENSTTTLRYIDELSIAVIAFIAGSELYLKEIRSRMRAITGIFTGVVLVSLPLLGFTLFYLTEFIPFTAGMAVEGRLVVAILGATILLALSPASTIAVIKEVRARGPYAKTMLGVTVTMDVVIIVLFAVAVAVSSALLTGMGFEASFALLLFLDLGLAVGIGYLSGKLLQGIIGTDLSKLLKITLMLALGYGIFAFNSWLVDFSYANLPFELHIEPILVAMIAGFMVTNFSNHRDEFEGLLHDVSPVIYVAFFTLTGVGLKLDVLATTWPIAVALFLVRMVGIGIGSLIGSRAIGAIQSIQRYGWLGLITQAGIALGLAREVAIEFPALGDAFATIVVSVVVMNEIFGPMFLKTALIRAGEAHVPEDAQADDTVRDAVILGIEPQSVELARQLQREGWQVVMADTDRTHVEALATEDVAEYHIPAIDEKTLRGLITNNTDSLVLLLSSDEENLKACEIGYELGVKRLIARLQDLKLAPKFKELGALVVEPTSAMVNLLDQSVRAPQSAAILLHQNSGREMIQVTVKNPDVCDQLVRDLRLPSDVLFLDLTRNGTAVVPNGYTRLKVDDEVTVIGKRESLEEVVLKLGY